MTRLRLVLRWSKHKKKHFFQTRVPQFQGWDVSSLDLHPILEE